MSNTAGSSPSDPEPSTQPERRQVTFEEIPTGPELDSPNIQPAMPNTYRQPQFLTHLDEPILRIRCPVHGFIRFSPNEREIIDHHLFRRLRYIRQLALTEFVYPGATHTRFEHALGVMEVATRMFDRLASVGGNLLEANLKEVSGLEDRTLAKARQILRLAALLHDIGHACFSHAAEEVIQGDSGHEGLTVKVITEPDLLGTTLDNLFFSGFSNLVAKLISGVADVPQLQLLKDIVSGQMDADRTDYLLRDSLHCGVEYGRFDYRRMIECLQLYQTPAGSLEIALYRDGIHTFEALILARFQMNTQVYYHRIRRIYDLYLKKYFLARDRTEWDTPAKILKHDDITMMSEIVGAADDPAALGHAWAARIRDRRHHRMVLETGEVAGALSLRFAREVLDELKRTYPDCDFQFDRASPSIHKLLIGDEKDAEGLAELQTIGPHGVLGLAGEKSLVLHSIPRDFQVARIFCDLAAHAASGPSAQSNSGWKGRLKEIASKAHSLYQAKGGH